ncbi:hypothetical protein I4F81_008209 [Pyropia yezoensis]|uniref:Uncharacterized protein n=1 Tax=Pyropia yezoensis TaxID=2788 RepID=A0ACC3C6A9_PYRYE|nr:hypothetical protein I4F81_008209 [Neopyropia yezoensis]
MHRNAELEPTATTWVESQVAAAVAPAPVYIVSRLDRPTSGAVALAVGSPAAAAALQAALAAPSAVKDGSATKGGEPRPASTSFTTLVSLPEAGVSVVSARLGSGRRHQVRRHLANGRLPIAGDTTHGKGAANRALRDAYALPRMFLHARALAFDHPAVVGGRVVAAVPLPADLVDCLERLPGWVPAMLDAINGGVPWEGGEGGGPAGAAPDVGGDAGVGDAGGGVHDGGAAVPGATVVPLPTSVGDSVP